MVEAFGGGVYFFLKDLLNHSCMEGFDFDILYGNRESIEVEQMQRDFPRAKLIPWRSAQREIRPGKDFRAFYEASLCIKQLKPDIIHCHSSKAGALGRVAALFSGLKNRVIYTPHGLSFLKLDDPIWKRNLYRYTEWLCSRLGGEVVGCSSSEVQALRQSRISARLIQNGVSITGTMAERIWADPIGVITVGRISIQKNPQLFNDIASSMPELSFTWVGDGEYRYLLTSKNIRVTGWQPREEIASCISKSLIYLSTSSWEGLPLSVLEAMSQGMPLLLSRCVGHVDVVNEENGKLFNERDEAIFYLKEMIGDPKKLQAMGKASRELVEKDFSVDKMVRAYFKLYQSKVCDEI